MTDNVPPEEPVRDLEEQQAGNDLLSHLQETVPAAAGQKQLRGWGIILVLLLAIALVTIIPAIDLAFPYGFRTWDLNHVGYDLLNYVKTNQRFPPVESWCDAMLESGDKYHSYSRYTNNKEIFPYTLNRHVLGRSEIPDNMVVLICGSSGWNQIGDYESVKNRNRLRVFFGNGEIHTFRKYQIPYLRWKVEDSGVIPNPGVAVRQVIYNVLLAAVFVALMITGRRILRIFWVFALIMGILSAAAGSFLGMVAEKAYYRLNIEGDPVAPWFGGIWGFLTGVSFAVIIGRIYLRYHARVAMTGYATVLGAVTGIIASSIVHGYLMITYRETSFAYLAGGCSFGIIAGIILGGFSSLIIGYYQDKPAVQA